MQGIRSILKLLSANLRYKKGAFTGIVLLMAIMTLSYAITVSNNRNLEQTISERFDAEQIGDWIFMFVESQPEETIADLRKKHPEITQVWEERVLNLDAPVRSGDTENSDLTELKCDREIKQIFNEKLNGFQPHTPLQPGEVYLSYKLHKLEPYAIGSRIQIKTKNGYDETFTVKGYYQEVAAGTVGTALLHPADFDRIYNEKSDPWLALRRSVYSQVNLHVCVQEGTDLRALQKTLKQECHLFQDAVSVVTKEEQQYYVMVMSATGTRIVCVFTILLVVIVLIVIGNSISTTIEMEYTDLGILKANGFHSGQLRAVWVLHYTIAILLGSVIGILLSVPATHYMGRLYTELTFILTSNQTAYGRCMLAALAILLICMIFVIFATRQIGRVSPVRAISGGYREIYFDSPLHMRIRKRGLSFFLVLRQLTSRGKSYIGSMLIVMLMVFFLCTVMIFASGMNEDLFVLPTGDIELSMLNGEFDEAKEPELQAVCERFDPAAEVLLWTGRYMYAEDERILLEIYNDPSMYAEPLEGRSPKYSNEVSVTELFAQKTEKQIGDTITVKNGDASAEFIITGYTQTVIHPGGVLELTREGGKRIGISSPDVGYIRLSDLSQKTALTNALNAEMAEYLSAEEIEPGAFYADVIRIVDLVISVTLGMMYSVSILFTAIVVSMICRRIFLRERTDMGILRAVGFSVPKLRRQFALRFLLIAVVGSGLGCICSACCSVRLLSKIMRLIGITRFAANETWLTFFLPAAAVSAAFFVVSYAASRRIRTVSVRELTDSIGSAV